MDRRIYYAGLLLLLLTGCSPEPKKGNVSGTVTDVEGNPVAGAEVFVQDEVFSSTQTLANGTYYLTGVPEGFTTIRVRAVINGQQYTGQQVAQIFENDHSKSVNIMIAREDQQGSIEGRVLDPAGRGIEGARVFVAGALSSALAVTDKNGYYHIGGLPAGFQYPVVASKPDYDNDRREDVEIVAGQITPLSFALNFSTNKSVNTPQNLTAIAWTLAPPPSRSRDARTARAYEAIKQWFDPARPRPMLTRQTPLDRLVEIDLNWDFEDQVSLLGYGIYRGRTLEELDTNAIAFLRDPLASFFADLDLALQPEATYYYEIVALNTDFLNDLPGSMSGRSNRVSARPFLPLEIGIPSPGAVLDRPPTFSWQTVPRAEFYQVLVYDRFPDYQVNPYWPSDLDNPGDSRVSAPKTSVIYNGPTLTPGRTYYFVMIAFNNDRSSRAMSSIIPFSVR